MGVIARRFRWLEKLFPPAQADPPNPSFLSGDIVLVHLILQGSEDLARIQQTRIQGAVGVKKIVAPDTVPADRYWWVFAASMLHTDPTARGMMIYHGYPGPINVGVLGVGAAVDQVQFAVPRAFLIGPGGALTFETPLLDAGAFIRGEWTHIEMEFGHPGPPGS